MRKGARKRGEGVKEQVKTAKKTLVILKDKTIATKIDRTFEGLARRMAGARRSKQGKGKTRENSIGNASDSAWHTSLAREGNLESEHRTKKVEWPSRLQEDEKLGAGNFALEDFCPAGCSGAKDGGMMFIESVADEKWSSREKITAVKSLISLAASVPGFCWSLLCGLGVKLRGKSGFAASQEIRKRSRL